MGSTTERLFRVLPPLANDHAVPCSPHTAGQDKPSCHSANNLMSWGQAGPRVQPPFGDINFPYNYVVSPAWFALHPQIPFWRSGHFISVQPLRLGNEGEMRHPRTRSLGPGSCSWSDSHKVLCPRSRCPPTVVSPGGPSLLCLPGGGGRGGAWM